MRRGKDYRLNIVLGHQDTIPGWTPCDEEQLAAYRHLKDIERTWIEVIAEQEGLSTGGVLSRLPSEQVFYGEPFSFRQTLVDRGLASLNEDETHALAEEMAQHGIGAVSPAEIKETIAGNDVTLFPNRWMRVPDHVFAQYGRLEDRRPFPGVA